MLSTGVASGGLPVRGSSVLDTIVPNIDYHWVRDALSAPRPTCCSLLCLASLGLQSLIVANLSTTGLACLYMVEFKGNECRAQVCGVQEAGHCLHLWQSAAGRGLGFTQPIALEH